MSYSFSEQTGDGTTTAFIFAFVGEDYGYYDEDDIHVEVNEIEVPFFLTGTNQVTLNYAPASGAKIRIMRIPNPDTPYTDFQRGNQFGEDNINKSFLKQLYLTHRIMDGFKDAGYYEKQDLSMGTIYKVKDMAEPELDTDATTKGYVDTAVGNESAAVAQSAAEAAASANNASISESNALNSASASALSASNASTSESNANTSANNASISESNASTSESNASTSESNASDSADAAALSASNASTSESNAGTSASNASISESNASDSASASALSASNASTSESNASDSAVAAATSAGNAEISNNNVIELYDNFDDRYLGAKTADPTLDNDGDALLTGALYFNTTSNYMKVYTGSIWILMQYLTETDIKTMYEANANTNAFTDANVTELASVEELILQNQWALSPGIIEGGEVLEGTNAGTFKVTAITKALLRTASTPTSPFESVTLEEQDNQVIPTEGIVYYVAFTYGTPCNISLSTYPLNGLNCIPIGKVSKNSSNVVHFISGGYRFNNGVSKLHKRAMSLQALTLKHGATIAYAGTNNFTLSQGIAFGGINEYSLSTYNSTDTQFTAIYNNGSGGWTEVAMNAIDHLHYDDLSGTLALVGNNRFDVHYIFKHISDQQVYVLYGLGSYSLSEAILQASQVPEAPLHLTEFGVIVGSVVISQAGGSFAKILSPTDQALNYAEVANHANLSQLDYANSGHTGFAKSGVNTDITSMTGLNDSGIPLAKVAGATSYPNTGENAFTDTDKTALDTNTNKRHTQGTDGGTVNNTFIIGDGANSDKTLYANTASTNKPGLRYNSSWNAWTYSDDGETYIPIGYNVQSDWSETDTGSDAYIQNKPDLSSVGDQNVQADWNEADTGSDAFIQNKPDVITDTERSKLSGIETGAKNYPHSGEQAFTDTFAGKLNGIAYNAEVNVQADWNESNTGSDAFILNKPTIPVIPGKLHFERVCTSADNASTGSTNGAIRCSFSTIITNTFNQTTNNLFTCQISGVYVFNFLAAFSGVEYGQVGSVGTALVAPTITYRDEYHLPQGIVSGNIHSRAITICIHLTAGQTVYPSLEKWGNGSINFLGEIRSAWSGYCISLD